MRNTWGRQFELTGCGIIFEGFEHTHGQKMMTVHEHIRDSRGIKAHLENTEFNAPSTAKGLLEKY